MPLIKLKYKNTVQELFPINVGQSLTIGRNDSNDIVIDNAAVSGAHARIDFISSSFVITDLKSKNGTFVNRKLVSTSGLKNNDVILIGKHELIFDQSDFDLEDSPQDPKTRIVDTPGRQTAENFEETRYLDTAEYKELIEKAKGQKGDAGNQRSSQASQGKGGNFFSKLKKKISG